MPTFKIDEANIHYEIVGVRGTWVVVMSGGRHPVAEVSTLAHAIAAQGRRVILYERRNCGKSSLHLDADRSEEDIWTGDLNALLDHLNVAQAFMVGKSRTARVALRFALQFKQKTLGLGLWGISGGDDARRFLDDYYYGKYLRACAQGGMEAVCELDHFAALIAQTSETRDLLLRTDPQEFRLVLRRWREHFLTNLDQTVMGVSDTDLRRIGVPTAMVPYYDRMHPMMVIAHARRTIAGSSLFDFDPTRHNDLSMTHVDETKDSVTIATILCGFEAALLNSQTDPAFA